MTQRNASIDGFRGIAASLVVFSHATAFRLSGASYPFSHVSQRLAVSLSEIAVQIFFVISGFIITSLLIREENSNKYINIVAFYARRSFRILPPLLFFMCGAMLARRQGWISFPTETLGNALLFTCNTGLTDCQWWVAHTWSLAVEEQYYLAWPIMFALLRKRWRMIFLSFSLASLLSMYWVFPHSWHSNFISFACIAAGALFALSAEAQVKVKASANWLLWALVVALLVVGPLVDPLFRTVQFLMPALILYLIFTGSEIGIVRAFLESRVVQFLGYVSYSLYLWQQLFLADPDLYAGSPIPLVGLVIASGVSVMFIERPSIVIGQRLSNWLKRPQPNLAFHR